MYPRTAMNELCMDATSMVGEAGSYVGRCPLFKARRLLTSGKMALWKHRRLTLERLEKFLSFRYFKDANLYGQRNVAVRPGPLALQLNWGRIGPKGP